MTNRPEDSLSGAAGPFSARLRRFLRFFGISRNGDASLRASLEEVIEEHEEEADTETLGDDERSMLMNVLSYGDLRIEDVMVPRADIVAADINAGLERLMETIANEAHSRIPVYRGSLDDVLGMVHVKDLMRMVVRGQEPEQGRGIEGLLRPVLSVPPSMKLADLLRRMKAERTHMSIVVDEFGGTDGIVTIEDLVEQIVGDIEDEHDDDIPMVITEVEDGRLDMDARLPLVQLEERLKVDFLPDEQEENIGTVGGLVVSIGGRVPQIGEVLVHELGYRFEVLDADPRRLKRLRVHLIDEADGTAGSDE